MKGMVAKMDELFMDDGPWTDEGPCMDEGPWRDEEFCDGCEYDFYETIDQLVRDVKRMKARVVYLRYCLSQHLPEHGEMLRWDIFSDLNFGYWGLPAYQMYIDAYHGGQDPFDEDSYVKHLWKLSRGKETVNY